MPNTSNKCFKYKIADQQPRGTCTKHFPENMGKSIQRIHSNVSRANFGFYLIRICKMRKFFYKEYTRTFLGKPWKRKTKRPKENS